MMKELAGSIGLCGASGGATWLSGAPWPVVVVVTILVLGMSYGVVLWLADPTKSRSVSNFLITWEAPSNREDSPSKRKGR